MRSRHLNFDTINLQIRPHDISCEELAEFTSSFTCVCVVYVENGSEMTIMNDICIIALKGRIRLSDLTNSVQTSLPEQIPTQILLAFSANAEKLHQK